MLEHFPLDETAIAAMEDIATQEKSLMIARQATLNYFARIHKITGTGWRLAENQKELVREAVSEPVEANTN
jgi:hypothetical protein